MNSEETFIAATRLLGERGQLLNAHLFRLVEGDKTLFREIRDRLVESGVAEDRSGVGLVRVEETASALNQKQFAIVHKSQDDSESFDGTIETTHEDSSLSDFSAAEWVQTPDWWLMTAGVVRGPMDLVTLCFMRQKGELLPADVVRQGTRGLWQNPEDVPLLAAARPKEVRRQEIEMTAQAIPFVPPAKTWKLSPEAGRYSPSHVWNIGAGIVGGSGRLAVLLVSLMAIGAVMYWWQLPPPARTIYKEFTTCRAVFKKLQDRRVNRNEWDEASSRYRPRIQYILNRLKPRASAKYPIEKALYHAGTEGVLSIIDNPGRYSDNEIEYEKHIKIVRDYLEGANSR